MTQSRWLARPRLAPSPAHRNSPLSVFQSLTHLPYALHERVWWSGADTCALLSSSRSSSNMASLPLPCPPPRPPPLPHAPPVAPKRDIAAESGWYRSHLPTAPTQVQEPSPPGPLPVGGASNPWRGLALPLRLKICVVEPGKGVNGCDKRVPPHAGCQAHRLSVAEMDPLRGPLLEMKFRMFFKSCWF